MVAIKQAPEICMGSGRPLRIEYVCTLPHDGDEPIRQQIGASYEMKPNRGLRQTLVAASQSEVHAPDETALHSPALRKNTKPHLALGSLPLPAGYRSSGPRRQVLGHYVSLYACVYNIAQASKDLG